MELCNNILRAGFKLIKDCNSLDLIKEKIKIRYAYFSKEIIFILNIPVQPKKIIDDIKLFELKGLPVKVKEGIFYESSYR